MRKTLIVAGLIGAASLATAGPAGAAPGSSVSCSPVILCTINSQVGEFTTSVNEFFAEGPQTNRDSVTDLVTNGPKTFQDSVKDLATNGPKTFRDSITNPMG